MFCFWCGLAGLSEVPSQQQGLEFRARARAKSAKLLKNGTLETYKDFPHGMPTTQAETTNADLLAFFKS